MPLRNVYTSLFSTGLHLQNSLLKVRHLEGFFEALDKAKHDGDSIANIIPNEAQLLDRLKVKLKLLFCFQYFSSIMQGFQDIQSELNACLTCLDDGVEEIDYIARPASARSMTESELSATESSVDIHDNLKKQQSRGVDDKTEIAQMDEVFQAFIAQDTDLSFDDDFVPQTDTKKSKKGKKQSNKIAKEMKSAFVQKESFKDVREVRSIARQQNVDKKDEESIGVDTDSIGDPSTDTNGFLSVPKSLIKTNILGMISKQIMLFSLISSFTGLSQETDSDAESIRSDTNTVKSNDSDPIENGFDDHRNSLTRTVSDSSDSNMSDAEVKKSIRFKISKTAYCQVDKCHKMYSRTMSSSYCQVFLKVLFR